MSTIIFTQEQLAIIEQSTIDSDIKLAITLFEQSIDLLTLDEILLVLSIANILYRSGFPIFSDITYDTYLAQLSEKSPEHPYLSTVETDIVEGKTVTLPQKMLSTDKAYSFEEISKWITRLLKAAEQLNIDESDVFIRITPKLDGYAAYDDGATLYTRGDGNKGQDITRAFNKGLQVANNEKRGLGPGEIVIKKSYFDEILSEHFENSRNIQAAIIAEKKVDETVQKAINDGACIFFPFAALEHWTGHYKHVLSNFVELVQQIRSAVDYDIDGVIFEVTNDDIKAHMGATRHHHRWQIAFKENDESAEVKVLRIVPQTSRTGRISPVAELEPTKLSGATISRVTVHHYNMVKTNKVGSGAIIQLVRSGLVIPKIEKVIKEAEPELPENCPSCGSHIIWESDHLVCPNKTDCPAQTENTLVHFFKTLGNNDGFGPKVIAKLHEYNVKRIHEIYKLPKHKFISFGFGDKTSQNLVDQLNTSKEVSIEDWRFLAAFGVSRLAGGNCEKLLAHYSVTELFDASVEDIVSIEGFAELSAQAIVEGLLNIKEEFFNVYQLGFNLVSTPKISETQQSENESPIKGQMLVFTGTMTQGSRGDMEKQAKILGAKVGKSVSGKTNFLIAGIKVGENKINAAKDKGVTVLSESEYLSLINHT